MSELCTYSTLYSVNLIEGIRCFAEGARRYMRHIILCIRIRGISVSNRQMLCHKDRLLVADLTPLWLEDSLDQGCCVESRYNESGYVCKRIVANPYR